METKIIFGKIYELKEDNILKREPCDGCAFQHRSCGIDSEPICSPRFTKKENYNYIYKEI